MKVLITILGKGPYKVANYELPNGSTYTTKLVGDALSKYVKPDKVYVVGTSESLWELADKLIGDYEKVEIPYGKSYEEFWEMFRILSELDVERKEIYLDITHGFRSIPLFVSTLVNLFTKVKGARIKGIYYGIWEAKYKNENMEITPVVDLLPIIELNEWIEGFTLFANYGDGHHIKEAIEKSIKKVSPKERKALGNLNSLPKVLERYSQAVGFNAPDHIIETFMKLSDVFSSVNYSRIPIDLEPIRFLKEAFLKESDRFKHLDKEWKKQLNVAKWLFEKRRYTQAIIVLEESIFTYIMENLGLDILDKNKRMKFGALFKADCKEHKIFSKNLNALFSKIQTLRNRAGHAFMEKNVSEREFTTSINKLEQYINQAFEVLNTECIKDKEKILEIIGRY